ncbi:MAG: hypothetical protein LC105_11640 [Chitinophagales bacterium]|nr:hypothetical protein [Chitinophagales bacterium]MCZ2394501.1 hypothetical protein [Chitinophagales bacterium]
MKLVITILLGFILVSCQSKNTLPEFVEDPALQEDYIDKALDEAQSLIDSLENTTILNSEFKDTAQ